MPSVFHKHGVQFTYPQNWVLEEEDLEGAASASVFSPDGSFWSMSVHPPDRETQPIAEAALAALKQTYDNLDAEPAADRFGETEMVGFDVNFYCLDLINTAWIRSFRLGDRAMLVMWQAEDRALERIAPVFRAITHSLLNDPPERL